MLAENARNEQLLAKISDYFEKLDPLSQEKVSSEVKQLCQDRAKQLIGSSDFETLKNAYEELASFELLAANFTRLVGNLKSESQRSEAEQLRRLCQKVYGTERFDPGELTSWLTSDQKLELEHLIQDPGVSDDAVYERIFEFYEKADDEKKTDARKVIESGCRRFVDRMFGDKIAAKLEERRLSGNYTPQMLTAELAAYAAEIKDVKNRIKAE
ncbi:unnamed protein product [Gongylonema pulchrum]|uniref:Polyprotein allergen nematode domain-containing protein n=1 Tax=Gongylonema pulchrum TaxID=637853 RepID=A0A3P7P3Q1_9BILA|nr:unnamed protein product [Gongylonema pulchrum]